MSGNASGVDEVLFSLASADRVAILRSLQQGQLNLTQLAKRISVTPQEASRHLVRLSRSALIERLPSGAYRLTGLGTAALRLLPAWEILTAHREFFLAHDLLALPEPLLERVGALSRAEYEDVLARVLTHTGAASAEAREYIWVMADQVLDLSFDPVDAVEKRGLSVRSIIPSQAVRDLPQGATRPMPGPWPERLELRLLDDIRFGIAMNEHAAGVVFADMNGKLDFNRGFRGEDPAFHNWCHDLFESHWNRAKRFRPL